MTELASVEIWRGGATPGFDKQLILLGKHTKAKEN
jgi:hypothetical protein